MASITMTASFLGGATLSGWSPVSSRRRLVVANAARVEGENAKVDYETKKESNNNGRRDLMFAAAAAAVCSAAGMAVADEPKWRSAEAKKIYAPICVTMPTARICHN